MEQAQDRGEQITAGSILVRQVGNVIHPGTNVLNSYLGFLWWDNETDGDLMYPKKQHNPTDEERYRSWQANPESAALHLWPPREYEATRDLRWPSWCS